MKTCLKCGDELLDKYENRGYWCPSCLTMVIEEDDINLMKYGLSADRGSGIWRSVPSGCVLILNGREL